MCNAPIYTQSCHIKLACFTHPISRISSSSPLFVYTPFLYLMVWWWKQRIQRKTRTNPSTLPYNIHHNSKQNVSIYCNKLLCKFILLLCFTQQHPATIIHMGIVRADAHVPIHTHKYFSLMYY